MNLLISFILTFSVNLNGVWEDVKLQNQFRSIQTCQEGLRYFRQELGNAKDRQFVAFECIETWVNADGSRYVRPE